jgi:hypothetical protein
MCTLRQIHNFDYGKLLFRRGAAREFLCVGSGLAGASKVPQTMSETKKMGSEQAEANAERAVVVPPAIGEPAADLRRVIKAARARWRKPSTPSS